MDKYSLPKPPLPGIPVSEFFAGRHVFITGATGFMGKVLIEKLLWSCEDIGNLYLLMRSKKGEDPKKRLDQLLRLPVFNRLKLRNPKILSKLVPISGDVMELNLGLSEDDRKLLESQVSVVYHVASSVRFDDPLKKAIILNVRGTRDVMELAKNMTKLKVVVYISTTYCNTIYKTIEEKVIPADFDWKTMISVVEANDESILNIITPKIIDQRPNTYTFTKSLAENVVYDYSTEIPSIIFRPSIVTYSMREPIPGWVDNLNGPVGLATGVLTGVLHTIYGDADCISDYVPCDFAINGIILAGWYGGINPHGECKVINGASSNKKLTSISRLNEYKEICVLKHPPNHMLWYPSFTITKNKVVYYLLLFFAQLIPAFFIDVTLHFNKFTKISLLKIYRKVYVANMALSYFMTNEWKISIDNYYALRDFLNSDDKITFDYVIDNIDVLDALLIGANGMKKYIYKDDMSEESLKRAKIHCNRLRYAHKTIQTFSTAFIIWLAIKMSYKYTLLFISHYFI